MRSRYCTLLNVPYQFNFLNSLFPLQSSTIFCFLVYPVILSRLSHIPSFPMLFSRVCVFSQSVIRVNVDPLYLTLRGHSTVSTDRAQERFTIIFDHLLHCFLTTSVFFPSSCRPPSIPSFVSSPSLPRWQRL